MQLLLTWSLLLSTVYYVQSCPDNSLYNTALNETLSSAVRLLKDNLPYKFTAKIPYKKCERTGRNIFETEYTVTFTNATITLLGSCRKSGDGCKATCPAQVKELEFIVKQSSVIKPFTRIPSDASYQDTLDYLQNYRTFYFDAKPVVIKPYNVTVNYEGTVTIEIQSVLEDGQPVTYVQEPLFGNHGINEKNNFSKSERVEAACVNKVVEAFEGLLLNKGWFWTQFDNLVRGYGHSASSKACLEGSQLAVKIAKCLDTAVNGEYLKCLRETIGWEELNWDTIFDWICKGRINVNSLETCNNKLLTDIRGTQSVSKQVLHKCIHESSSNPSEYQVQ